MVTLLVRGKSFPPFSTNGGAGELQENLRLLAENRDHTCFFFYFLLAAVTV